MRGAQALGIDAAEDVEQVAALQLLDVFGLPCSSSTSPSRMRMRLSRRGMRKPARFRPSTLRP